MRTQKAQLASMTMFVLCFIAISLAFIVRNPASASAQEPAARTVQLDVIVKDKEGNNLSGARVVPYRSWAQRNLMPVAPPDYEQMTNPAGVATFNLTIAKGETLKLSIEVSYEDMKTELRSNIDFSRRRSAELQEPSS